MKSRLHMATCLQGRRSLGYLVLALATLVGGSSEVIVGPGRRSPFSRMRPFLKA